MALFRELKWLLSLCHGIEAILFEMTQKPDDSLVLQAVGLQGVRHVPGKRVGMARAEHHRCSQQESWGIEIFE